MTVATASTIDVTGVVQGVGFRPFVYRLANELALVGLVGNSASNVFIEVMGRDVDVEQFVRRLTTDAPPLARVDTVQVRSSPLLTGEDAEGFRIVASRRAEGDRTLISPDSAVCADCVDELFDTSNRRHGHPFITCTNCGPRLSIITDLPYDRHNTTMIGFAMCPSCVTEYEEPTNRRYHAQPIGCHDCGPRLSYGQRIGEATFDEPLARAAAAIDDGGIVAVKGVGGYHLVCDATNASAIAELRRRKHRPDRPFAVMVRDTSQANDLAHLCAVEIAELESPAHPILLASRRSEAILPALVAPGNPLIGILLPYAPVHHLLMAVLDRPLVVTSANPSGAPLAYSSSEIAKLFALYDGILEHDREIHVPVDDSVVRQVGEGIVPLRRARGYAPIPVSLSETDTSVTSVLAVGGELKNTFCLTAGTRGWVSPHIGDMENLETLTAFERMVAEFTSMYNVAPDIVAVDAHPGYLGSKWARRTATTPVIEVQHHHAHVASVMAEHQLDPAENVVGIAFDGTGYGEDGTIWGGEVLIANAKTFTRAAHLRPVLLPGGDAAIRNPSRVALSHLFDAGIPWANDLAPMTRLSEGDRAILFQQLDRSISCVPTTSMGRLFDAVASLLDVRHEVSYEAQAAIELEILAEAGKSATPSYRFSIDEGVIDQRPVLTSIITDLRRGRRVAEIAWCFHDAVAAAVEQVARTTAAANSTDTVVLTGGVFQNALLLKQCVRRLACDLDVRTHKLVPANDGGLSLGQAYVAAHSFPKIQETETL